MGIRRAAVFGLVPVFAAGAYFVTRPAPNPDLTRAIGDLADPGGLQNPARSSSNWLTLENGPTGGPRIPASICWSGNQLLVVDSWKREVQVFDAGGQWRGSHGKAWDGSPFADLSQIACAPDGAAIALADQGARRLFLYPGGFGSEPTSLDAPMNPQGLPLSAAIAHTGDGKWFSSWLGTDGPIGPYLSGTEWNSVQLVEQHARSGEVVARYGRPVAYENTVARRVFNHTDLVTRHDTLWVLTQADATVHRFVIGTQQELTPIRLPIYFRGREPDISIRQNRDNSPGFRYNTLLYHPNVGGLALLDGDRIATVRYEHWGWRWIGKGFNGTFLPSADSFIEVADLAGRPMRRITVPGYVTQLTSDGAKRLAVVTRLKSGKYSTLITSIEMQRGQPIWGST